MPGRAPRGGNRQIRPQNHENGTGKGDAWILFQLQAEGIFEGVAAFWFIFADAARKDGGHHP
jgi:hypothetical protein